MSSLLQTCFSFCMKSPFLNEKRASLDRSLTTYLCVDNERLLGRRRHKAQACRRWIQTDEGRYYLTVCYSYIYLECDRICLCFVSDSKVGTLQKFETNKIETNVLFATLSLIHSLFDVVSESPIDTLRLYLGKYIYIPMEGSPWEYRFEKNRINGSCLITVRFIFGYTYEVWLYKQCPERMKWYYCEVLLDYHLK